MDADWSQEVRAARGAETQQEFAQRVGVVVGTVSQWELGKVTPSRSKLAHYRRLFAMDRALGGAA